MDVNFEISQNARTKPKANVNYYSKMLNTALLCIQGETSLLVSQLAVVIG